MLEPRIPTAATGRVGVLCVLCVLIAGAIALLAGAGAARAATMAAGPPAAGEGPGPSPGATQIIPANVSAGGVDLSNLSVDAGAAKLAAELARRLSAQVVVGAEGRVFRLSPYHAGLRLDALGTAQRAYRAGIARPAPAAGAAPAAISVRVAISHSQQAVTKFVAGIARSVNRAPVDATVRMTLAHMYVRQDHDGLYIVERSLVSSIDAAIDSTSASHIFHERMAHTRPHVTASSLPNSYPAVITIDRDHFRLRLFRHLRFVKSYGVAVGRAGLATPAGLYHVQDRQVNPSWHVPNASWAGSLAGQTIPPGPNDPIKARWLGLANGVGIHGTAEDWSIGSRASHGCIRMHVSDVIELYRQTPLDTHVLIK